MGNKPRLQCVMQPHEVDSDRRITLSLNTSFHRLIEKHLIIGFREEVELLGRIAVESPFAHCLETYEPGPND